MRTPLHAAAQALFTLAAGLSLWACAGANSAAPDAAAQVDRLIGQAACSRDDDCATIGVGAMACGGPQAYAAWSKTKTDVGALTEAVARQRSERERQIARTGEQSVCMVVPDPGARCNSAGPGVAGRCELRAPAGGGAAPAQR